MRTSIIFPLTVLALSLSAKEAMATTQEAAASGCFIATTDASVLLLDENGGLYADIGVLGTGPGITSGSEGYLVSARQNSTHVLLYDLYSSAIVCDADAGVIGNRGIVAGNYAYSTHPVGTFVSRVALDCSSYTQIDVGRTGFVGITKTDTHIWVLNSFDGGAASIDIQAGVVTQYQTGLSGSNQPYTMLFHDGEFYYTGSAGIYTSTVPPQNNATSWQLLPLRTTDMEMNSSWIAASSFGNGDEVYFIPISQPFSFLTRFLADSRGIAISQYGVAMAIGGGAPDVGLWRYDEANSYVRDTTPVTTLETWSIKYMPPPPICGDDVVNGSSEQCDGIDLDGQACTDIGFVGGTLACNASCQFDTTGCHMCGNGSIDSSEACDGNDFGSSSCTDFGFDYGTLACTAGCQVDTAGCLYAVCGDNIKNGDDECDGADFGQTTCTNFGFDYGNLTCTAGCAIDTTGCLYATCGDGIINGSESCDGSQLDSQVCTDFGFQGGDLACDASCEFDLSGCYSCGDGVKNGPTEQCDGNDFGDDSCQARDYDYGSLTCTTSCQVNPAGCKYNCGNGVLDSGEECDDGNRASGDGCDSNCKNEPEPACGNGEIDSGEVCDGNAVGDYSCADWGWQQGTLSCAADCLEFDTSMCSNPPDKPKSGCGCSHTPGGGPSGLLLLLGCIGLLLLRRRKVQ